MKPIDTDDGLFHDGNPYTGALGTPLPAWWANQIQAELLAVITAGGFAPSGMNNTQLLAALQQLFMASDAVGSASVTDAGIVELATAAEVAALTDGVRAVTAAALGTLFTGSITPNGYYKFPRGLMLQWQTISANVNAFSGNYSFPTTFPEQCFGVVIPNSSYGVGAVNGYQLRARPISTSQFYVQEDNFNSNGQGNAAIAFVISLGK